MNSLEILIESYRDGTIRSVRNCEAKEEFINCLLFLTELSDNLKLESTTDLLDAASESALSEVHRQIIDNSGWAKVTRRSSKIPVPLEHSTGPIFKTVRVLPAA